MEYTYKTQFPDFELELTIPNEWEDVSWKNDACPSWTTPGTSESPYGYRVFIDYKNPEEREHPVLKRFSIFRLNALEETDVDSGEDLDDFEAVLTMVNK
jgi:hypothetical protein